MERMNIDCEKVANIIIDFIKKKIKEERKDGVVLGLSGGVDSSTVAFLAKNAMVDPRKVHAIYLPDQDSQKRFENYVQKVSRRLGIIFRKIVITEELKKQDIYKHLTIRITTALPFLNQLSVLGFNKIVFPLFFKKLPFIVTLEKGSSAKNFLTNWIYKKTVSAIEEGFNIRHRIRRKILEEYAKSYNLLLIGCANRSEFFLGWFVNGGVDDLPIEPILGLYKNQVLQLARYLEVPEEIIKEAPSPDMFKNVSDEDCIGYTYEKIDKVAYVLEHGLDKEIALNEGVTPKEFEDIKTIHQLSAWKRENPHEFPSIS